MWEEKPCNDCGAEVGSPHAGGCDVARCTFTGRQRIMCGVRPIFVKGGFAGFEDHDPHPGRDCGQDTWTGEWPGTAECEEFGWWSVMTPDGWQPVPAGTPGASADLNRLAGPEAVWDRDRGRWWKRADVHVTKTGKVLTDDDIAVLADEAEQGYDVSRLTARDVGGADVVVDTAGKVLKDRFGVLRDAKIIVVRRPGPDA